MAERDQERLALLMEQLASLPKRDRRAVERQLDGLDRMRLRSLRKRGIKALRNKRNEGRDEKTGGGRDRFREYSPWLSKRLGELLNECGELKEGILAPAATETLSALLTERSRLRTERAATRPTSSSLVTKIGALVMGPST